MRLLYSTRRGFDSSAMTLSELGVGYPIGLVSLTRILIALPSRRSASPASKSMKLASFATQDATQYYRRCRTRDLGPLQERQRKQVRRPALKNQQGRKRIELCRGCNVLSGSQIARATKRWCPLLIGHRSPSASAPPRTKPRDRECGGPNSMKAAGFFSLATSKCPPASSTTPSPRDPFGSDHARAILPRPSTARSIDATTLNALGSISSTRGGVSWSSKMRPRPSAQTASIWGSCLGSIEPDNFAMLLVCQSIWSPSLRGWENQAIFACRRKASQLRPRHRTPVCGREAARS